MSKLPVLSGNQCVKALCIIGFEVHRQRGSHIVLIRKSPSAQTTIPNHKRVGPWYATRNHSTNRPHGGRISGVALRVTAQSYSLSNSRVVCSVTLGRWASSLVRTCWRVAPATGMLLAAAGGNEPRAGPEPKVEV